MDGVEIDSELEEVGNRFFDMGSNENLTVHNEDARPWLRRSEGGYDAIFVDAYRQPYIPFYLATEEFFELVRDRLAPGGVVVVNAGHPEGNDDLEKVLGRTMAEVFPNGPARPDRADQHAARRERGAALGGADAATPRRGMPIEIREPGRDRGGAPGAAAGRRRGLHGRSRAGRVADRPLDPRLRGR